MYFLKKGNFKHFERLMTEMLSWNCLMIAT
jgi:hypothetical protein